MADHGERGFSRHRHVVQVPQSVLQYVQSCDELSAPLMRPLAEGLGEKCYPVTQLFGFDPNSVSTCRVKGPWLSCGARVESISGHELPGLKHRRHTQSHLNPGVTSAAAVLSLRFPRNSVGTSRSGSKRGPRGPDRKPWPALEAAPCRTQPSSRRRAGLLLPNATCAR